LKIRARRRRALIEGLGWERERKERVRLLYLKDVYVKMCLSWGRGL